MKNDTEKGRRGDRVTRRVAVSPGLLVSVPIYHPSSLILDQNAAESW